MKLSIVYKYFDNWQKKKKNISFKNITQKKNSKNINLPHRHFKCTIKLNRYALKISEENSEVNWLADLSIFRDQSIYMQNVASFIKNISSEIYLNKFRYITRTEFLFFWRMQENLSEFLAYTRTIFLFFTSEYLYQK